MANIDLSFNVPQGLSLDDVVGVFHGENDPATNSEVAPYGSLYLRHTGGGAGELWIKYGSADNEWILLGPLDASDINLTGTWAPLNGTVAASDTLEDAIAKLAGNQIDLTTLSGVAQGAVDLGTFTGITISDNVTIKVALQELETKIEPNIKRTTITESIDVSTYTGIRQDTAGITTTLTGAVDGKKIRIHNASGGKCTIGATISGEVNPTIHNLETFDMEYHLTEGEWTI